MDKVSFLKKLLALNSIMVIFTINVNASPSCINFLDKYNKHRVDDSTVKVDVGLHVIKTQKSTIYVDVGRYQSNAIGLINQALNAQTSAINAKALLQQAIEENREALLNNQQRKSNLQNLIMRNEIDWLGLQFPEFGILPEHLEPSEFMRLSKTNFEFFMAKLRRLTDKDTAYKIIQLLLPPEFVLFYERPRIFRQLKIVFIGDSDMLTRRRVKELTFGRVDLARKILRDYKNEGRITLDDFNILISRISRQEIDSMNRITPEEEERLIGHHGHPTKSLLKSVLQQFNVYLDYLVLANEIISSNLEMQTGVGYVRMAPSRAAFVLQELSTQDR
jgi:hypothetical protein